MEQPVIRTPLRGGAERREPVRLPLEPPPCCIGCGVTLPRRAVRELAGRTLCASCLEMVVAVRGRLEHMGAELRLLAVDAVCVLCGATRPCPCVKE